MKRQPTNRSARSSTGPPGGPRRPRSGIKYTGELDPAVSTPPAMRIAEFIRTLGDAVERTGGYEYARMGQVIRLEIRSGIIEAAVQGTAARPYTVRISGGTLSDETWARIVQHMGSSAGYSVMLDRRQWPHGVEDFARSISADLFPTADELRSATCECGGMSTGGEFGALTPSQSGATPSQSGEQAGGMERREELSQHVPCRHVIAASYVLMESLEREPLAIVEYRGRNVDSLLAQLAHVRGIQTQGVVAAHPGFAPPAGEGVPHGLTEPLESMLDEFWRAGPLLEEVDRSPPPHHVSHALLRRLGPAPLPGRFPLVGLLASVYDAVSEHADSLRDRISG